MENEVIDDLSCGSEKSSVPPEQTNLNNSLESKNTEDDDEVCVRSSKKNKTNCVDSDSESDNTVTITEPHNPDDPKSSSDEEDLNIFKHKSSLTRKQNTSEDDGDEDCVRTLKKRRENLVESDSDSNNVVTNLKPFISDDHKLSKNDEDFKTVKQKSSSLSRKYDKSDDNDSSSCIRSSKKQKESFEDSDSDSNISQTAPELVNSESGSDDNDLSIFKHKTPLSRIRKNSSSDESKSSEAINQDLPEDSGPEIPEHQIRIKNKTKNLKKKFKYLVSSRSSPKGNESNKSSKGTNTSDSENSSDSNTAQDDLTSIEKIKQKIKEQNETLKSTIYDPDTSDDERAHQQEQRRPYQKSRSKKADSPKPVRMSAKQAMENMQKIKSESNRMLREKEVSLPYHRPKALSLKDIMSRRKPALSADGKALPLKMNDEQLRQYAKQLEERQKEIVELCKSDTEEEKEEDSETIQEKSEDVDNKKPSELNKINDSSVAGTNNQSNEETNNEGQDTSILNDELFDSQIAERRVENIFDKGNTSNIMQVNAVIHTDNGMDVDETAEICKPNSLHYDSEKIDTVTENTSSVGEILINDKEVDDSQAIDKEPITASAKIQDERENESEKTATSNADCSKENYESVSVDQKETIEVLSSVVDNSHEVKEVEINIPNENGNSIEGFSDDDAMDIDDIDQLIENADLIESSTNKTYLDSPMLIKDSYPISKPKLTGAPGMVIDLDGSDPRGPNKLSGIQLLKERFNYFAKLKTPEELERQTKNKIKPGTQHLKLKQELEDQIAEQRSLEWAKRLEEEKQQQKELNAIRGEDSDGDEDDIEKLEAKFEIKEASEAVTESEPEENDVVLEDKPKKHNPLVDEEAEESDCDDDDDNADNDAQDIENEGQDGFDESSDDESTESESDDENVTKQLKKGRILKAFEDSDDEESGKTGAKEPVDVVNDDLSVTNKNDNDLCDVNISQDEDIQLAQMQKSISDDVFATQESESKIEESGKILDCEESPNNKGPKSSKNYESLPINFDKVPVICETQLYHEDQFDEIAGMCSGSFTQNITTLPFTNDTQKTPEIGDDIAAMCTGNFVDNQFLTQDKELETVSQYPQVTKHSDRLNNSGTSDIESSCISKDPHENTAFNKPQNMTEGDEIIDKTEKVVVVDKPIDENLKSILDELHDQEFDSPKPYKFFTDGQEKKDVNVNNQMKKKFTIDSDDEEADKSVVNDQISKKKKRKKLQDRALQISDDEEELSSAEENEEDIDSDIEEKEYETAERLVEYDSEENEVEITEPTKKVKRKATDFFEQEAELSSEDEWAGSGDEDEAGLDRMEREAGDDDTFHQGKLQRELGKIHMRDVLDQDKREVRLLQELLLEDGDLGGGHRQRKFRWKNADAVEEGGAFGDSFLDTPEEQAESEEQWRKQRHERELFLRQMIQKENDSDYSLNITSSSTIIKASLTPDAVSSNILEVKSLEVESPAGEKKTVKDIPSPAKKPFMLMQQYYRGSLLARGSNTLGRLAAIATPIAGDGNDDTPKISSLGSSSKRNFVFAAVSPSSEDKPKVNKRKAEPSGTPNLMKKMKTDDKRRLTKCSLLDHMKT